MSVKIDQAFVEAFIAGAFGLEIAYENQDYTPTEGTPYAEIVMIPNDITPLGLAQTDETDGIFRVLLNYPENKSDLPAKQKADEIFAAFPIGRVLTYSGQRTTITNQSRARGVPEDGWYRLSLSFSYRSFLTRG